MTNSSHMRKSEVGEVRPSQTLTTFGIGSLVDLPNMSVIVMGLDDWPSAYSNEIAEARLMLSAQSILGSQVTRFLTPPRGTESQGSQTNWFDDARQIGVPVAPFPRWMVCSKCRLLAPISSGLFEPKAYPYRPDRACYVHNCSTQGRAPRVVPARFMVTCEHGHLDDFPWVEFVHQGTTKCKGLLHLYEVGVSGEALDIEVKCEGCGTSRRMGHAFGPNNRETMPACRGRRPHLRDIDPNECDQAHVKPMLQGASNLWFPVLISALSVPQASDDLGQLIEDNWEILDKVTSPEVLTAFRLIGKLKDFGSKYNDEQIWTAIQANMQGSEEITQDPDDLKSPEWRVFSNPSKAMESRTFKLQTVEAPDEFMKYFDKIVLVEKLREVRALVGFTRIISPRDFDSPADLPSEQRARISRKEPTWIPASETRGEGIFFQFSESLIQDWIKRNAAYDREFELGHQAWRETKNLDPTKGYPGIRYVLLHTYAHALIRQLAIECGYTSASITERIYSRNPSDGDAMAGVLIYTSAPDSEGTLGGLCALGEPDKLGRHIRRALEKTSMCASDPLCSEHRIGRGEKLHGASCHACSFVPETSCERGNKYLDRSVLTPTLERANLSFFE